MKKDNIQKAWCCGHFDGMAFSQVQLYPLFTAQHGQPKTIIHCPHQKDRHFLPAASFFSKKPGGTRDVGFWWMSACLTGYHLIHRKNACMSSATAGENRVKLIPGEDGRQRVGFWMSTDRGWRLMHWIVRSCILEFRIGPLKKKPSKRLAGCSFQLRKKARHCPVTLDLRPLFHQSTNFAKNDKDNW